MNDPHRSSSPAPAPARLPLSRRGLIGAGLGGAAGAVGAGLGGAAPLAAASGRGRRPLAVDYVTHLTGVDITGRWGVHWADLGVAARCPDGRTLYVFGDTFGPAWGENWRSPTAMWASTPDDQLASGVVLDEAVGGDWAEGLILPKPPGISTFIPSDVITIGDTMYLNANANAGFANVVWSGIWASTDNGASWHDTGARFPGEAYDSRWQMFTWELGDDGWVYVFSAEFLRVSPMILHRVRPEHITDPEAYQPWGRDGDGWRWGAGPDTVTDDNFGEMSLRQLDGRWVLTWFDPANYRISATVLNHPTDDLRTARRTTLLTGTGWDSQTETELAQLYGSYVIPGSTLNDLHLTVSQWKTDDSSVYHVLQYRFRGLGRQYRR